jgi:hypothetical protein
VRHTRHSLLAGLLVRQCSCFNRSAARALIQLEQTLR